MKLAKLLTGMMLFVCLSGCGGKSTLEGKLTEAKGKPIGNMKVVAKQVQGNGKIETLTKADGTFIFEKLVADTEYELIPYWDNNTRLHSTKVTTAPKGQTKKMSEGSFFVFYQPTKDGVLVRDSVLGLFWMRDAGKTGKMNWNEAINSAKQANYAGFSDWRLPTIFELKSLALYGGTSPAGNLNKDAFTNVQADSYWSSDVNEKNTAFAWAINMADGKPVNDHKNDFKYFVWLVRSEK